jgi:two-component system cell cycle response regulator DivK
MKKNEPVVLIVDDQPDNLYMYARYIDTQSAFQVVTAMTGAEALVKARRLRPDIILLDLSMPVMNGYEVARALAQDEETRGIPVVLVSAYASRAEAAAALGDAPFASFVGEVAAGYVSKPCLPEALLKHLQTVLDGPTALPTL